MQILFKILGYGTMLAGFFILLMNFKMTEVQESKLDDAFGNYLIFSLVVGLPLLVVGILILFLKVKNGSDSDRFNPEMAFAGGDGGGE